MELFNFPEVSQRTQSFPVPGFMSYEVDLVNMKAVADKYQDYKNIILVAHGGSASTFYGIYHALRISGSTKQVYFVSTPDPEYISEIKSKCSQGDSLVLAISKSGQDMTMLESLSAFFDYKGIVISEEGTPLVQMGEKLGWEIVVHPAIGGRFTGLTEVALLPAALCGLDLDALVKGAKELRAHWADENEAWQMASALYELEKTGLGDVFVLIYSRYLFAFNWFISQICHETFGKDGKGLTFVVAEGPEWQHHTMQRFLGGPNNVAGVFIGIEEIRITSETEFIQFADLNIKTATLGAVQGLDRAEIMKIELESSLNAAKKVGRPVIKWVLSDMSAVEIGRFIAFWQMFAVYSAYLRGVEPFDQPAVEQSKINSFEKRIEAAGK